MSATNTVTTASIVTQAHNAERHKMTSCDGQASHEKTLTLPGYSLSILYKCDDVMSMRQFGSFRPLGDRQARHTSQTSQRHTTRFLEAGSGNQDGVESRPRCSSIRRQTSHL